MQAWLACCDTCGAVQPNLPGGCLVHLPGGCLIHLPGWCLVHLITAEALVGAAKRLMPQMNQQELCNTVWALGVLGQLDGSTWEQFCQCVGKVQGESSSLPWHGTCRAVVQQLFCEACEICAGGSGSVHVHV
jgi:hypothetical protein